VLDVTTPHRRLRWLVALCVALVLPTGATVAAASSTAGLPPAAVVKAGGHDVAALSARTGSPEHLGKPDHTAVTDQRDAADATRGALERPIEAPALTARIPGAAPARGPPAPALGSTSRGSTP
jgi:hypothetical protein